MDMIQRNVGLDSSRRSVWQKSALSIALSQSALADKTSNLSLNDEADGHSEPKRAKTLDGGFFETFATVYQKQRGFLKQAKADSKRQAETLIEKQVSDASSVFYPLFTKDTFTHDQGMLMYQELLYVVSHQLGKRKIGNDEINPGDLIVYGQKAFGVSREEHKELYHKIRERKPPKTFVVVTVLEAKGLEAKDANGLSDPYCMLGILRDMQGRKVSKDGRKVKKIVLTDLQDEERVQMTKVKDNTLDPVWNEQFKLEVHDVENEILRIDLWDKDDASVFLDKDNRITAIKGFSGFSRFLKEVASSAKCDLKSMDDFLGLVDIYIRDIPSEGMEEEFDLEPRSKRSHVQGSLKVKVRLTAVQEEHRSIDDSSISTPMKFQRRLLKWFYKHDYEEFFNTDDCKNGPWSMQKSKFAEYLHHQFCIQNALSPFQEAIVRWEIYSDCIQKVTVPMEPLMKLLDIIRGFGNREDLSYEETDEFINSLDGFLVYSMQLIRRHRLIFPPTGTDQCLRLGQLLLCLLNLYKLPLFKAAYPDRRFSTELEAELKIGTKEWFDVTVAYNEALERNDESQLTSLVTVTNSFTVYLKAARKKYITLFKPTGIDYYSLVYSELERLLAAKVRPIIDVLSERMKCSIEKEDYKIGHFELYLSLKNFQDMKAFIPDEDRIEGPIDQFHKWFELGMNRWLSLAKDKSIKRIKRAVELDEVRAMHSSKKYSASAVDVTWCLSQICIFWNKLQWPDPDGSYVFLTQITNIITSCATEYVDIVQNMLRRVDYYEAQSTGFDINEKLCLTINNLEHVLQFLDTIPELLNFESVLKELCKEYGEHRLESLRETLEDVIGCAQEDMRQKLDQIIVKTGERMRGEITKKLHHVCKTASDYEDPYELSDGVLSYLDHNLVTLHRSLLFPAFKRCLIHVWEVVLFSMEDVVRETTRRDPKVFSALRQVLYIAQEFFSGDGNGIPTNLISISPFKSLDKLLLLYELPSATVIENYYIEKCEEQERSEEAFGAIAYKVFYSQENNALHVEVSSVRDLPPLDSNQLADPYVHLELMPKHVFKGIPENRTSVQPETRYAIFDENFSFQISKETCKRPGATLVMTLYDRDRFYENEMAGEVFVDLTKILGLEDSINASFFSLRQVELPLIHGSLIGQTFQVLSERKDSLAVNFVKSRKEKFRKMEDCIMKARERLSLENR